jgi:hypothetical protein
MNNEGRFQRRWIALMVQMPGSKILKLAVKPRVLGMQGVLAAGVNPLQGARYFARTLAMYNGAGQSCTVLDAT